MSEQIRCNNCGYTDYLSEITCSECGIGRFELLHWTKGGDGSHWDGCEDVHWDCRIAQLEARIAELEQERRWIPVSERLPEVKGVYLCYLGTEDIFTSFFGDSWDGNLAFRSVIQPTHWMPLPEPPEEER